LTSRRQFAEVYARGRRVGSSSFTLFGLPNDLEYCRVGLTVPRKVGNAVRRNRVKRLLRELFRHNRVRLEPRMDLVINARPAIAGRSVGELEREFLRSFSALARRKRS
jgi:ribonuclease P protein component